MKISDKKIRDVIDALDDFYGVRLTEKQVAKYFLHNPRVVAEIKVGMDTVTRETLIDTLSMAITGKEWPYGGDSMAYKRKFKSNFKKAAKKNGIAEDIELS